MCSEYNEDVECNIEEIATWESDEDDDERSTSLEAVQVDPKERTKLSNSNEYIRKRVSETKMHILQDQTVRNAYESRQELGLFQLFLQRSFIECVRQWTNKNMERKGQCTDDVEIRSEELYAYVGIEIATSLIKMNDLKEYWSTKLFCGHLDFQKVMSRDRFLKIRSLLQIYPR